MRVKRASLPSGAESYSPEYDDLARLARERNMPLRRVLEKIMVELHRKENPGRAE